MENDTEKRERSYKTTSIARCKNICSIAISRNPEATEEQYTKALPCLIRTRITVDLLRQRPHVTVLNVAVDRDTGTDNRILCPSKHVSEVADGVWCYID